MVKWNTHYHYQGFVQIMTGRIFQCLILSDFATNLQKENTKSPFPQRLIGWNCFLFANL